MNQEGYEYNDFLLLNISEFLFIHKQMDIIDIIQNYQYIHAPVCKNCNDDVIVLVIIQRI